MKNIILAFAVIAAGFSINAQTMSSVPASSVKSSIQNLISKYGETNKFRINKGVAQAAAFWTEKDGSPKDFESFCNDNYINDAKELDFVFQKISTNLEVLMGNYNKISVDLKLPLHLDMGKILPVDEIFGSYDVSAHFNDDMFNNKLAFICLLNFPFYNLKEKSELGKSWTRQQWAYARMGDLFTSRVPAEVLLKVADAQTAAESYIADYNIMMGYLLNGKGNPVFPQDMKLITHWGLRDELKSNYNKTGLEKQQMIYEVMKHIIYQDIPQTVINNNKVFWNPYTNKVFENNKEVAAKAEPDIRYQQLLNNFKALKAIDIYSPQYSTYIQRAFDQGMEITQENVEKLFMEFISSPQVNQVAKLISKRLGRKLQPFDIWYDGFKSRSTINEDELTAKTKAKYPNRDAFEKDLPDILQKLGFSKENAAFITSKVRVDASRGAGHAWGAQMKSDKARLRTRIGADGMNYKGYNIAVHEFGHNVEQTISLHKVDNYIMNGVPNTAFTEALAFIFQKRDLELLGIKNEDVNKKHMAALDNFWACYEIMGVSLVDMNVWKWLYEHPDATPAQLKETVIRISKEVWNRYYAPVFGINDQPILAIYSHMIDAPLYLSAYPVGHLIDFQIEKQIEGKNFADEVMRMYSNGKLIPQIWMLNAVGKEISIQPMMEAATEALKVVK
ncbi:MAG: hypothetical protein NTZ33_15865 [Bacteroidetes bacterium]|nr:hypothetical protein [Bacteroidota bacterium]